MENTITQAGRKPVYALTNAGDLVIAKKLTRIGNAFGVIFPKEWLDVVKMKGEPYCFILEYTDGEKLIIRPWYDEDTIELGVKI